MANSVMTGGFADYDLENQQLERRRRMAEMLAQQGMGNEPKGGMVGNVYVAPSWTQQLSAALDGPMAAYQMRGIDKQQKELGQRKETEMQGERQKFADLLRGTPASAKVSDDQLAYGGSASDSTTTQMPAVAANPSEAWNFANSARDPALRGAALAQLLKEDEAFTLKDGERRYKGGKLIAEAPRTQEFGTTPQYEKDASSPTGFVAVVYGKQGERKVIGPANPMNQFTTGTVDAARSREQKMYEFNNLSAADRQRIQIEAQRLGISAQDHFFNTGMQAPGALALPQNAPPPQFGAPQGMPPQGMPQAGMPQRPMPQGVPAPGTGMRAPGVGQAPQGSSKAILEGELSDASNRLAQAMARGDAANVERLTVDIQSLQRELGIKTPQTNMTLPRELVGPGTPHAERLRIMQEERGRQGTPQGAQGMPPQGAPVMSPKNQQALALEAAKQKQEMDNKREFNMSGLGSTIDDARTLLSETGKNKPTNSYMGALTDMAGQIVGYSPDGSAQADKLKSLQGVLTMKMPRMEGPQSDKDVQLYREMAGQVGDNTLPVERRLAALDTVEQLWRKYDKSSPQPTGASGSWGDPPAGAVRRK